MHLKLYTVVSLVGIVQHWDLLHNIELEEICSVCMLPSAFWNITLNIKRALVLFFLALANPILCSTSAFLSFNIPTLSTLWRKKAFFLYIFYRTHWYTCTSKLCKQLFKLSTLHANRCIICVYLRYTHVCSRLHTHFYYSRSLDVPFTARCRIFSAYFTGLVEAVWLHATSVITHKHPQQSRFHFANQLRIEKKLI